MVHVSALCADVPVGVQWRQLVGGVVHAQLLLSHGSRSKINPGHHEAYQLWPSLMCFSYICNASLHFQSSRSLTATFVVDLLDHS